MSVLPIVEKFVSLQGEGPTQGMPTSFIRVAGCNLKCFYCDTKYAFDDGIVPDEGVNSIINWAQAQWPEYVCITGGEPLIYINITDLIEGLVFIRKKVVIETNGTIDLGAVKSKLPDRALDVGQISFVMDFKSPEIEKTELQSITMINNLREISEYDSVKFVISPDETEWALEIIEKFKIKNAIISPIVMLPKEGTWTFPDFVLVEYVHQFMEGKMPDVRFQIQTHKLIYGDQRGV